MPLPTGATFGPSLDLFLVNISNFPDFSSLNAFGNYYCFVLRLWILLCGSEGVIVLRQFTWLDPNYELCHACGRLGLSSWSPAVFGSIGVCFRVQPGSQVEPLSRIWAPLPGCSFLGWFCLFCFACVGPWFWHTGSYRRAWASPSGSTRRTERTGSVVAACRLSCPVACGMLVP